MAITITNTNAVNLLNILNRNMAAQSNTLRQLATGKRINSGKDDPAGLMAVSALRTELTAIDGALSNNMRTDSILTVADSAIAEISSMLQEIETLVINSNSAANLSNAEIAANQSQIDDALAAIDRLVRTTDFNGRRLIDGSQAILTAGVTGNSDLNGVRVFSRSQSTSDTTITVTRVASAQVASATFAFAGGAARTSGQTEVAVAGTLGTATISFSSGLTQAEIVTQINAAKDQTGVSAIQGSNNIELSSTTLGRDAFVSVSVLSGGEINTSYGTSTSDGDTTNNIQNVSKQEGVDADITINGQNTGADGLDISYSANGLSLEFTLGTSFGTGGTAAESTTFTVKASGGATFQMGTTTATRATIGIDTLATYDLGGGNGTRRMAELKSGGAADLRTDAGAALTAVREAISEVNSVRGRLGGFQKYQVGTAINQLQAIQVGLQEAASLIEDTDFAKATTRLNQENVLISSSISLLGLANQQSSLILALLG